MNGHLDKRVESTGSEAEAERPVLALEPTHELPARHAEDPRQSALKDHVHIRIWRLSDS